MASSALRDNYAMLKSTENLMALYRDRLIPKARQDFELALAGYVTGKVEAITAITRLKALIDYDFLYWRQFTDRQKAEQGWNGLAAITDYGAEREMNKRNITIVVIALLAVAGALAYLYRAELEGTAMRIGLFKGAAENKPAAGHQHGAVPVPAETKESPGAAEETEETPTVEVPTDKQQLIGVRTVKAAIQPMNRVIRTVGRVEFDEKKLATANTKIEGWIEKLHVDYVGRYVQKGEPLAEIFSPELVATQQEFLNILRWANQGKGVKDERTADAPRQRRPDPPGSGERAAAAVGHNRRTDTEDRNDRQTDSDADHLQPRKRLCHPEDGGPGHARHGRGKAVRHRRSFQRVDRRGYLRIRIAVHQGRANGQDRSQLFPGKEFSSRVDYIYPSLASETRTAKVRFTIPNPDGALKPQMFTNVEIKINLGSRLAVPSEAVIDTGVRQIVYVDKGEGYFEPREVRTGTQGRRSRRSDGRDQGGGEGGFIGQLPDRFGSPAEGRCPVKEKIGREPGRSRQGKHDCENNRIQRAE